jgi:diaminopropionate ammonia-lyase
MPTAPLIDGILNPNFNPRAFPCKEMISAEIIQKVFKFHQSLPGYQPTKTHSLEQFASQSCIQKIYLKDESTRFDLKAFKVLGASYAMAEILAKYLGLNEINFEQIVAQKNHYKDLVFATTTDGNHGRAVAWSAQKFGCKAIVTMPKGSSINRLNAIKAYGAEAHISKMGYDDCVQAVNQQAQQNNWILIQDTSWAGYEDIPMRIMQGYFSLVSEFRQQFSNSDSSNIGSFWPSHVLVQAGVGTLAASIALAFRFYQQYPMPKIIVVEPVKAACFFNSIKINDGLAHRFRGELDTMMAGLACGEPAIQAWQILSQLAYAFVRCDDQISFKGMRLLAQSKLYSTPIISGESAAVGFGVLTEMMENPAYQPLRKLFDLNSKSKVLLFSTEGDTDSEIYDSILKY